MSPLKATSAVVCLTTVLVAGGCGKDQPASAASQVVAKVNSEEITVHQLNALLARSGGVPESELLRRKREGLERLVDQRLAVQQALERKLDRSASVQRALETAKSEILANAFYEQIAAAQPKPSDEETRKYYAEHPELFAQRRVFALEQIVFRADDNVAVDLRERVAKGGSLKEIAQWAQQRGIQYSGGRAVRAAEEIPLELLPRLHKAKEGELLLIENGERREVIRVAGVTPQPVDEATASTRIRQFLANRRVAEAVASEIKQLKAHAKIVYVGEFAEGAAAVAKDGKTAPPQDLPAKADGPLPPEAIQRGVRAMK